MELSVILLIIIVILVSVVILLIFIGNISGGTRFREEVTSKLDKNYEFITKIINEQMGNYSKSIKDITSEITSVKETNKQVLGITKQIDNLDKVLKSSQKRGVFGEKILEQILGNILPVTSYKMQYQFKNGGRADAVIFLEDDKIVAIDSKFPLETYKRYIEMEDEDKNIITDLKNTIKKQINETSKYISPEEGTLNFAFMFLPSESLYYELLTEKIGSGGVEENLIEYAFNKFRVIIVSPNTIFAYLITVQLGLRSLEIEKNTKEILKNFHSLHKHFARCKESLQKIGLHLRNTDLSYNDVLKQYEFIDKDLSKIEKIKE